MPTDDPKGYKSLDAFLGENKEKSIKEILNADRLDEEREKARVAAQPSKPTIGKHLPKIIGGLVILILGCILLLSPLGGFVFEEKVEPNKSDETVEPPEENVIDPTGAWYDSPAAALPVNVPKWQLAPANWNPESISDAQKTFYEKQLSTQVTGISGNILPSKAQGFTDDPRKAVADDGGINPFYVYWTADTFTTQSTQIANALINPIYGNWIELQYSYSKAKESANLDTFPFWSEDYIKENSQKKDKSFLPLYADWESNDYGLEKELIPAYTGKPRWIGTIENSEVEFDYDEAIQGYRATVKYDVKYTAWTVSQKKIVKSGRLTLVFRPLENGTGDAKEYRVRVDQASLKMQ